ncbi:MAG TPA: hypothetical protein VN873_20195 [Candidatus Angelobacter sp.]|nr:hypothetical protein [Candidatus Angelobacter sp.]
MKELFAFFARLNPSERRFVVGVAVLFFIVANVVWIFPHFGDWGQTRQRMDDSSRKLAQFATGTNQIPDLQKAIDKFEHRGESVPAADQAVHFVRLIQSLAAQSGVIPSSMSSQRQPTTNNAFFVEQSENITLQSTEKQLVDFLYNLGAGDSLIRVRVLSVQPDQSHTLLTTRATLVASYQKGPIGRTAAPAPNPRTAPAKPKPAANTPKPAPQKPAPRRTVPNGPPARNGPGIRPGRPNVAPPVPAKSLTPNKR